MVWAALCVGQRPVWFIIKPPVPPATKKTVNADVYREEILLPFFQHLLDNNIDPKKQFFMQVLKIFMTDFLVCSVTRGAFLKIYLRMVPRVTLK